VDVDSNEVVSLIDFVSDASYNVYRFGVNDPRDGEREVLENPAHPAASPFGWHTAGFYEHHTVTIGNNVYAQENFGNQNI